MVLGTIMVGGTVISLLILVFGAVVGLFFFRYGLEESGFHVDRIAGGHRDYRHFGVFAPACSFKGKVGGSQSGLS